MMLPGVRILRNQGGAGGSGSGGGANGGNPGGSAGEGGGASGGAAVGGGSGGGTEDINALPEWARKVITDTRTEAAGYRTRATKAEKDLQAKTDAELSEVDRLKKEKADLEGKVGTLTVAQRNAAKANILRDSGALRPNLLVGEISDDVFGDDGEPDEGKVKKLVDRLNRDYPEQFKRPGSANGGAGGGNVGDAQNMNDVLRGMRR